MDGYAYLPCFGPALDLYCAGPLALWRFSQLFLPNEGKYQKVYYHLSAEPLCHIMINLALIIVFRPQKG